jgi:iron complex transport system substrate-binding protein
MSTASTTVSRKTPPSSVITRVITLASAYCRKPVQCFTMALLAAAFTTQCSAPVHAAEIAIEHAKGRLTMFAIPKKIVVFDLASLDVLDALGVQVAGVPRGPKPPYLAKYDAATYPKVGTFWEPDYEELNALSPDLVIVGLRSGPRYDAVSKMAPTIDMTVDAADLLNSAKLRAGALASLFGKQAEFDKRIAELDAAIAATRRKADAAGTGLIVLTTGGRLSAFGSGSRFGVIHDTFGFKPAAPEIKVGLHGQPISFEFIRKVDPDWLFVLDRDAAIDARGQPARQLLDNELVRETKAWRKGNVVYLDAASFYLVNGGLTSLQRMIEQIRSALDAAR